MVINDLNLVQFNITDLTAYDAGISRRGFGRAFWDPKTILSCHRRSWFFLDRVSPTCRGSGPAAFYSRTLLARTTRYFRPTCVPHTQHGGRDIGTVVAQWEFAYFYVAIRARGTPTCTALKAGSARRYATSLADPFESRRGTKQDVGPRGVSWNSRVVPLLRISRRQTSIAALLTRFLLPAI